MILDRITGYYRINKLIIVNNKNKLIPLSKGGYRGLCFFRAILQPPHPLF